MSAAIEGGASAEAVSMGFSCLAEDAPQVLSLFAELITDPALPGDKIELFKAQAMNSYLHRNDNPSAIPAREAARLVYGRDSVYVQQPSIKGLSGISVEDARQWLGQWERPDTAVLGIVGECQVLAPFRVTTDHPASTLPKCQLYSS